MILSCLNEHLHWILRQILKNRTVLRQLLEGEELSINQRQGLRSPLGEISVGVGASHVQLTLRQPLHCTAQRQLVARLGSVCSHDLLFLCGVLTHFSHYATSSLLETKLTFPWQFSATHSGVPVPELSFVLSEL